ncbi:hypothetical protein OKW50_003494 [Paraburkholderia youngii]
MRRGSARQRRELRDADTNLPYECLLRTHALDDLVAPIEQLLRMLEEFGAFLRKTRTAIRTVEHRDIERMFQLLHAFGYC